MDGRLDDRDRWIVPLSLAASFLANDGEELLTMAPTFQKTLDALPSWLWLPLPRDLDQRHVNVGIAMMGGLCAAAVANGIRTRGRGRLYQDFQWLFGLHGFGHLLAAAAARRYTTGSATSPLVVIPQLIYALRALHRAGVPRTMRPLRAMGVLGGWLVLSHVVGAVVSSHHLRKRDDEQRPGVNPHRGAPG
jgi:possible integral membrane protein